MALYRKVETSPLYGLGFALISAAAALLLTLVVWNVLRDAPFMLCFVAVIFSAWQGGFLSGLLAGILSFLAIDYLLVEPHFGVLVSLEDVLRFGIFVTVAAWMSWLEDQRNRSEQSLRELKDELEVIFNSVDEGITVQDHNGKVIFANKASTTITGQSLPRLLNTSLTQLHRQHRLISADGSPLDYSAMPRNKVFATGKPAELTFGLVNDETGDERWITLKSSPIFDQTGRVRLAANIFRNITESRRVENLRIENEQRLRKVLNNLAAFVGVMTTDGVLIEANRAALEAADLQPEDVLGKPFEETYWWSYDPQIQAQLRKAIVQAAQGTTVRYDVEVRIAKDHIITIDFILAPTFDHNGNVEFLIPSGIDVTDRNKLTDRLRLQQHRLETILNSIPAIVYEGTDAHNPASQQMSFVSEYAQQLLGYPLSMWQQKGNFWQKVVHPEDWKETVERAAATYLGTDDRPVPFRCITASGSIIHVEAHNNVITDLTGKVIGTCGIVLDVTERTRQQIEIKRLSLQIDHERQRLASIISNVPGIVFEGVGSPHNGQQRMDFLSSYIEKMLGYSPDEWLDDPMFWRKLVLPEDWNALVEQTTNIYEGGDAGIVQFSCLARDGRVVHVEARSSVLRDSHGAPLGAVGVMMDVTERRQHEEAMLHYAEELRRSNAELEQFAYVASHDLQEPLRMVTSYLQLIEQRYSDRLDNDASEFIGYAVDGATRMKVLINDLLAYSRIQRSSEEFESIKLEDILEQVLYNLQLQIEDTGAIITHDPLPELYASRIQMAQLLQNLIGNALKFRADRPPQIHIGAKRTPRYWHFFVRDNGIGIEQEYLERIFIIFQRLHGRTSYPGTGIGLAICKKIVDKHGGEIYAESTPGEGTTFHFKLPHTRIMRRLLHGANSDIAS